MKVELTSWLYCIFYPCSYYEKLIVSACYDEISDKEMSELKGHIKHCDKCKEKYDNLFDFIYKLNHIQSVLNNTNVNEDINVLPYILNRISEKRDLTSPQFNPKLKLVYSFGIVFLVIVSSILSVYIFNRDRIEKNNTSSSLLSSNVDTSLSYEGPLEKQKDKLRQIIKENRGKSIAGQALFLLADLEYTTSENYEEAYRLYSQLRENYPRLFSSTSEAVYRYNLLEETKRDNFKPLYALNSAITSHDNPIKQLERIITNYPGTMIANLAVSSMIECFGDTNSSQNSDKNIRALENIKGYLTEPTAIAQVNYVLGNLYWNQMRDFEKARTLFQSVVHSDSKQLHSLANEALTQLVSFSE